MVEFDLVIFILESYLHGSYLCGSSSSTHQQRSDQLHFLLSSDMRGYSGLLHLPTREAKKN